jgi:hypothetical protein
LRRTAFAFIATLLAAPALSAPVFTEQGATVLGGLSVDSRSASFADIDGDGDPDLLFQGGSGARHLLRNNTVGKAEATYTDVTSALGPVADDTTGWSAAWGDFDGDGDVDVFLGETNGLNARGDLFRNDGPAGFVDVSAATGLDDPGFHQNVAWCDIDNDLDLDLLIGMEGPEPNEIYEQFEPGHFRAIGASVGFQAPPFFRSYGMAVGDADGDGDTDVYISTCQPGGNIRNNFYDNRLIETGTLGFVDIADTNGTQFARNSYGAEFNDYDDDGDLDLFMVGADREPSKIWRNNGDGTWTDVDTLTGHPLLSDVGGDLNGARSIDYDNDGDLDLFFHDHLATAGRSNARLLYRNDGDWQFTNVTAAVGLAASNEAAFDSPWADFDLDGDLDLCAPTGSGFPERFFVSSASTNGNHWLFVRLIGTPENTTAIGAQLCATVNAGTPAERTLRRDANANAGTFHQDDLPVHFGLGAAVVVDRLRIIWPNGQEQVLTDVAGDQYLTVEIPRLSAVVMH